MEAKGSKREPYAKVIIDDFWSPGGMRGARVLIYLLISRLICLHILLFCCLRQSIQHGQPPCTQGGRRI